MAFVSPLSVVKNQVHDGNPNVRSVATVWNQMNISKSFLSGRKLPVSRDDEFLFSISWRDDHHVDSLKRTAPSSVMIKCVEQGQESELPDSKMEMRGLKTIHEDSKRVIKINKPMLLHQEKDGEWAHPSRRKFMTIMLVWSAYGIGQMAFRMRNDAQALVKGVPPPSDFGKPRGPPSIYSNIQEARDAEEEKERQEKLKLEKESTGEQDPVNKGGDKFRDLKIGNKNAGDGVKVGDTVDVRVRVLKQGKRASDGLSGEGTPVFSFGYGEDDDKEGATIRLILKPSDIDYARIVPAVRESLIGMYVGGIRRVQVAPERGWQNTDSSCQKTVQVGNAVGLPGAAMSDMESCLMLNRIPAPASFQGKRKLARRFDGTLWIELELVNIVE